MIRFIIKFLLALFIILCIVSTVDYLGDPANLFNRRNIELNAAKIISKGKHVTNLYNYNERLFQKYISELDPIGPNVLILGSSRTMLLGSDRFISTPVYNCCVSGASIEDFLAILYLYQQNKKLPKEVILGLDPWILNDNNNQSRYETLNHEYNKMISLLKFNNLFNDKINKTQSIKSKIKKIIFSDKIKAFFSPQYFRESIYFLILNDPNIYQTDRIFNQTITELQDGTIYYGTNYIYNGASKIDSLINNYIQGNKIYSLQNFTELSINNKYAFEMLIQYLIRQDIAITFFIPPYPKKVYKYFCENKNYNNVINAEKYFLEIASKYKIKTIGSYNPEILGLTDNDFYDGMHCNLQCIYKLVPAPL